MPFVGAQDGILTYGVEGRADNLGRLALASQLEWKEECLDVDSPGGIGLGQDTAGQA